MPIHGHTVHCAKQTHLTNSLLQDIAIFNKHDSTKLEEWLTDIETAVDLTNENQAKLAKAVHAVHAVQSFHWLTFSSFYTLS